jgi:hypothetical protein
LSSGNQITSVARSPYAGDNHDAILGLVVENGVAADFHFALAGADMARVGSNRRKPAGTTLLALRQRASLTFAWMKPLKCSTMLKNVFLTIPRNTKNVIAGKASRDSRIPQHGTSLYYL